MPVIDVHTHMLTPEFVQTLVERSGTYTVKDTPGGRVVQRAGAPFLSLTEAMFDYDMRLRAMDDAGVDIAIVSLTCPNVYWGDAATSLEVARLTNDAMADAQQRHPERIRFLASLPWQHPDLAVKELDRACAAGAVGVMVLANIDGVSLTDPRFADVWAAIDARGLPVLVHPTTPPGVENLDMARYHMVWSVGFTFDTTLALTRMILDGFFDRHSQVKIIGGHAGGTLPFLMGRLDAGHRSFESVRERIEALPSTYADRIYLDSIVYTPETLAFTVDVFGADHVLYGTDYPHKNGKMQEIIDIVGTLPAEQRELVYGGNAQRLFGL
ncbi:MAG: amidohydrolase family protein [Pseudonocardia sp.]